MTMNITSLFIRPICSIRQTDTFIHDVTSSFIRQMHLIIVMVTACIFVATNMYAVKINTEDKHRETCKLIPRSLSLSHKVSMSLH